MFAKAFQIESPINRGWDWSLFLHMNLHLNLPLSYTNYFERICDTLCVLHPLIIQPLAKSIDVFLPQNLKNVSYLDDNS